MRTTARRFPFRFTGANKAMAVLGLWPRTCYIDVTADDIVVRFGWAVHCRIPRASITSVVDDGESVYAWGAHGWRHVWLLNGTSKDLLRIVVDPMAPGRALVGPLRIGALRCGIDDKEGFRAALR